MACYIQILLQVWQKTSGGTESAQAHARALRRKKKITRMVFIVVVLFAFCWAPIHTFNIMSASGAKVIMANVGIAQWWKIFFLTLAYANSCINPFVYAFTTTSFKKYFKSVFGAACGQYSREGHAMSISMETKTERITTNSTKEDSSLWLKIMCFGHSDKSGIPREQENTATEESSSGEELWRERGLLGTAIRTKLWSDDLITPWRFHRQSMEGYLKVWHEFGNDLFEIKRKKNVVYRDHYKEMPIGFDVILRWVSSIWSPVIIGSYTIYKWNTVKLGS